MIKVAFDIRPLTNPEKYRGVGVYTQNLLFQLKMNPPTGGAKCKIVEFKDEKDIPPEADLVHYPYFNPFFVSLPLIKKFPTVVTVHDLIPLRFPQHFPKGIRGTIKWWRQKLALTGAAQIITDSIASQRDVVRFIRVKPSRVKVVYLAPAEEFQPASLSEQRRLKRQLKLPDRFVLYVGDFNWNKNVPNLVRACLNLAIPLVVAGGKAVSTDYDQQHPENRPLAEFQQLAKTAGQLTVTPGFLDQKDLIALYSAATFYCQPSYYEGFGLPVLEAMACGCPVICSRGGSLPEVAGEAALYIDNPDSVDCLSKTIKTGLAYSTKLRQDLIDRGFKQVKQFSWQKTARETIKVYETAKRS